MTIKQPLIAALALLALSPSASAAPSAQQLFERAKRAYMHANAESSLKLLRRATKTVRDTKLAASIELYTGLSLLIMNRRPEAKAAFRRALRHDPTLSLDKERFKPSTVALLESIKAAARGTLVVTANRQGKVWLDGVERGTTPLTLQVKIGKHRIQVRAGAARSDVTVVIGAGAQLTIPAHLPTSIGSSAPPKAKTPSKTPKPSKATPSGPSRLWTWIALGSAVASAGAGVAFGLLAKADHDDYMSTRDYDRFASAEDGAKSKALLANVFFIGAGVLAAGAVALFFIEGSARATERHDERFALHLPLLPTVAPGGGGLVVDLRF
ncbi:MAG: hypothetical protein CSA65_00120 [Proteobacteria bacterium]|nr:MAG: hypothetical protein CSA65_00120 [Pseudomonadota bacterium]